MKTVKPKCLLRIVIWVMAALLLILPCTAGAATNTAVSVISSFVRTSSNSAEASVYAVCSAPSKIVSEVTREIYDANVGDYVTDSNTYKKTKYNATSIIHRLTLPVQASGDYRIKIEVTDTYNNISSTVICYEYLQDMEEDRIEPGDNLDLLDYGMREEEMQEIQC